MNKINTKIKLLKSEHETVLDWFSFVDKPQRINVDYQVYKTVAKTIEEQGDTTASSLTAREIQIVMRWYYLLPDVVKDAKDARIIKRMNVFLKEDGI